jgi:hypothetical protein
LCSIAARGISTPNAPSWHTFICMQGIALQQMPNEAIHQGL